MLGLVSGTGQGDDVGAKVAVVGLSKIKARPGTRGALGVSSSVFQPL